MNNPQDETPMQDLMMFLRMGTQFPYFEQRQDAADRIEAAEAKLRAVEGLLKVAACPNCDGSGSYGRENPHGECEQVQCQFCDEREAALKEGEQP